MMTSEPGALTSWAEYLAEVSEQEGARGLGEVYVPLRLQQVRPYNFKRSDAESASASVEAFAASKRSVLIGEPGSGKSTTLLYLFYRAAKDRREGNFLAPLPLFVSLKNWQTPRDPSGMPRGAIDAFVADQLRGSYRSLARHSSAAILKALNSALGTRPVLLMFDGLDEIRDVDSRSWFVAALRDLASSDIARLARIFVAGRKYGFVGEVSSGLRAGGFETWEIAPLTPDGKKAILERMSAASVSPARPVQPARPVLPRPVPEVLLSIRQQHRLTRLSDNALLLTLLARNYDPNAVSTPTRGSILQKEVARRIASAVSDHPEKRDLVLPFLTAIALEMQTKRRSNLLEQTELLPIATSIAGKQGLTASRLIEAALETRLLQREGTLVTTVCFALPQYEEYFLAHQAVLDLYPLLDGGAPAAELRKVRWLAERERHHVLILAVGLLEPEKCERLASTLDTQGEMLLKARVLGESEAPKAEREFVKHLWKDLHRALRVVLRGLARRALGLLVIWWAGLLALAFGATPLGVRTHPVVGFLVLVTWTSAVPVVFRKLLPRVFDAARRTVQEDVLPTTLAAFMFLRSEAVAQKLRTLQRDLQGETRGTSPGDMFERFIAACVADVEHGIQLSRRDPDTVLNEIEENPALIKHWLALPPAAFTERDIEILTGFLRARGRRTKGAALAAKCVEKLAQVALIQAELRTFIVFQLRDARKDVDDVALERLIDDVANRAEHAGQTPESAPVARKRSLIAFATVTGLGLTVWTALHFGSVSVGAWLAIFAGLFLILLFLVRRDAAGANLLQKVQASWQVFGVWFLLFALVGGYVLPNSPLRSFLRELQGKPVEGGTSPGEGHPSTDAVPAGPKASSGQR